MRYFTRNDGVRRHLRCAHRANRQAAARTADRRPQRCRRLVGFNRVYPSDTRDCSARPRVVHWFSCSHYYGVYECRQTHTHTLAAKRDCIKLIRLADCSLHACDVHWYTKSIKHIIKRWWSFCCFDISSKFNWIISQNIMQRSSTAHFFSNYDQYRKWSKYNSCFCQHTECGRAYLR